MNSLSTRLFSHNQHTQAPTNTHNHDHSQKELKRREKSSGVMKRSRMRVRQWAPQCQRSNTIFLLLFTQFFILFFIFYFFFFCRVGFRSRTTQWRETRALGRRGRVTRLERHRAERGKMEQLDSTRHGAKSDFTIITASPKSHYLYA